ADLVERTTGRSATVVLDPVFLHDFDELVGDIELGNDLVIFSARPERFQNLAPQIAKKHGLRIVSLVNRFEGADECHRVLEPVRWLRLMKGARVVMTDYFHGMAVALKFGRPLIADAAPGKANKMADLAGRLRVANFFLPTSRNPLDAVDRALGDPREFAAGLKDGLEVPVERSRSFLQSIVSPSAVGVAS
ncbi:MAG: polysaccharide pyruvyl transferase family protein, partial [Planctomycetaceae bacterium]